MDALSSNIDAVNTVDGKQSLPLYWIHLLTNDPITWQTNFIDAFTTQESYSTLSYTHRLLVSWLK